MYSFGSRKAAKPELPEISGFHAGRCVIAERVVGARSKKNLPAVSRVEQTCSNVERRAEPVARVRNGRVAARRAASAARASA